MALGLAMFVTSVLRSEPSRVDTDIERVARSDQYTNFEMESTAMPSGSENSMDTSTQCQNYYSLSGNPLFYGVILRVTSLVR